MKNEDKEIIPPAAERDAETTQPARTPGSVDRRTVIRAIGLSFVVGGLAGTLAAHGGQAYKPAVPRGFCGMPSANGVGYNDDLACAPSPSGASDNACGLITNSGWGQGAGGAAYNDADCSSTTGPDNDCGKHNGPNGGGHIDANCGATTTDADCGMILGVTTINSDSDCNASGNDTACWLFDIGNKPNPGDDPGCIHFSDS